MAKSGKSGKNGGGAVAKIIELSASSSESIEHAVQTGVAKAHETLSGVEGVWVQDVKGVVKGGKVVEWRVSLKITFVLK